MPAGEFTKFHLRNGIRVVAEKITLSSQVVSFGIWIDSGSRDELPEEEGICHFIEHMLFKGTASRTPRQIAVDIDILGGDMGAFTTKECTAYYIKVKADYLAKGVELLHDILVNPLFNENELQKEIQVVLNEAKMVEDDPEDVVDELHSKNIWGAENPIGKTILGRPSKIEKITKETVVSFYNNFYRPDNIILSVAGNFNLKSLEKLLNSSLGLIKEVPSRPKHITTCQWNNKRIDYKKDIEQTHICISTLGLPEKDDRKYTASVLDTIFGGSVSSRLFQEIRENRGLAYSIFSEMVSYRDNGQFTIHAACDHDKKEEVIELILAEIDNLIAHGIKDEELERSKHFLKGNLSVSLESASTHMSMNAFDELYREEYQSLEKLMSNIENVTMSNVNSLIKELFKKEYFVITTLGQ